MTKLLYSHLSGSHSCGHGFSIFRMQIFDEEVREKIFTLFKYTEKSGCKTLNPKPFQRGAKRLQISKRHVLACL